MASRDRDDPGLPIKLWPASNGEFVPPPASPLVREALRRTRAESASTADRLGMSRRRFLLSSMGAALGLVVLDGCTQDRARSANQPANGSFSVPLDATTEPGAAQSSIGGAEAIFDVQTHLLDYEHVPNAPDFTAFPQRDCGESDPRLCFGIDHWMEELFLRSDTGMVVLSAVPIVGDADPLSIEVMERARGVATKLCGDGRVLLQGHAVPNVGRIDAALAAMEDLDASHPIAAWKVYTHAPGPGWSFVDATGNAFLDRVETIAGAGGTRIVAVHKGLSGGDPAATPADIGPAAKARPDLRFVVYHSGYEAAVTEGPFAPDGGGVDRLVRSLRDAGVSPGGNVYAELGSTWKSVMADPDQAAHVIGKLLLAVGENNVLWGTDSLWYGSPQDQIQAFRAFTITPAAQQQFGYPELTPAIKAKIFGLNAARLYGIDLASIAGAPCRFTTDDLEAARQQTALGNRTYGPVGAQAIAASFAADHPWAVR
jgi:predicted TIM-barrel fold metal-dependent hydrolase